MSSHGSQPLAKVTYVKSGRPNLATVTYVKSGQSNLAKVTYAWARSFYVLIPNQKQRNYFKYSELSVLSVLDMAWYSKQFLQFCHSSR